MLNNSACDIMDVSGNRDTAGFERRAEELVRRALVEDVGTGDVTTSLLVHDAARVTAAIFARSDIVVAGVGIAKAVFAALDDNVNFSAQLRDGVRARPDEPIAFIRGGARAILTGERTALNFLQRMSGIATFTSKFVEKAAPYGVAVLDTRKTTPLLRDLEKYSVRCGGGINHRMGLYDRILIKDNHLKVRALNGQRDIVEAVAVARRSCPNMLVEIEIESECELREALNAKPDWILLDNVSTSELRRYVEICGGKCKMEVSGGVNLDNIVSIAQAGVDAVSLGCLTHSAPSADLSLEVL